MKRLIEGSFAIAEATRLCRVQVVSAYPITPQTHIVEGIAQLVADGDMKSEFVNVESEFGAASVVLGASAVGARTFTATTSQGLLLMTEVLFNIAGLRLPVVLACANRAVSAPINIWNDHQDAMTVRDSGWIQLWAEHNQEAFDLHLQAFKLAEALSLPVMVNVDGFILTHAFEPIDFPEQEAVDAFLPPYQPKIVLDPANPVTMGPLAEPNAYLEARYQLATAVDAALEPIGAIATEFEQQFGRASGGLVESYRLDDAETVIVAMGSLCGTIKDAVDEMRAAGERVGLLRLITFRPFPRAVVRARLANASHVVVVDKSISLGSGGIVATEVRDTLYGLPNAPRVSDYVAGLGGRDITIGQIKEMAHGATGNDYQFFGLNRALVSEVTR